MTLVFVAPWSPMMKISGRLPMVAPCVPLRGGQALVGFLDQLIDLGAAALRRARQRPPPPPPAAAAGAPAFFSWALFWKKTKNADDVMPSVPIST